MKSYPSIGQPYLGIDMHTFDKLDGSNLRFEWSKKRGFYKFGTRNRLFDGTDAIFGPSIVIFNDTLREELAQVAVDNRWESLVAFAEFHGPNSFAGNHVKEDDKELTLFDVAPYKKGLLGPVEFRRLFEDKVPTPAYLGNYRWNLEFVKQVAGGQIPGVTFEGVVGKAGEGHRLVMAKAKTKAWVDKVCNKFPPKEAQALLVS